MTETALGLVKAEFFQVPTLIADIGPEAIAIANLMWAL